MDSNGQNGYEGNKVAEVKSGSVTVSIFKSRNSLKVPKQKADEASSGGTPEVEVRYYGSFIIPYYEGSIRKTPRRSTLEKAKALAQEIAARLSKEGAKAQFLSERDRRIYILARASSEILEMGAGSRLSINRAMAVSKLAEAGVMTIPQCSQQGAVRPTAYLVPALPPSLPGIFHFLCELGKWNTAD